MARFHARNVLLIGLVALIIITYFAMTGDQGDRSRRGPIRKELPAIAIQDLRDGVPKPPVEVIHVDHPLNEEVNAQFGFNNQLNNGARNVFRPNHDDLDSQSINDSMTKWTLPKLEGVNIVSMTLYGSQMRYTMGALRNAELIKHNFPGWTLRIYTETPSTSRYGSVPQDVMQSLRALGVDIYFMQPGEDFIPPMMWRFLIADDTWVDRFIVRDSDARLTQRDAASVYAWVKTDAPFTCVRDHPSHASYAVSGGMWGGKPTELRNILRRSWRDLMKGVASMYLEDMNFLNYVIWPKVQNHTYCVDSVSCQKWPGSHPFPVPRYGYEHIGQVVNEHDLGRPVDMQILQKAGENRNCTPVYTRHKDMDGK